MVKVCVSVELLLCWGDCEDEQTGRTTASQQEAESPTCSLQTPHLPPGHWSAPTSTSRTPENNTLDSIWQKNIHTCTQLKSNQSLFILHLLHLTEHSVKKSHLHTNKKMFQKYHVIILSELSGDADQSWHVLDQFFNRVLSCIFSQYSLLFSKQSIFIQAKT